MISHPDLPRPETFTLRISGERDASSLHLAFVDHVPSGTLAGAKTFLYNGEEFHQWSPGSGSYSDASGSKTTNITYNIGIQEQDTGTLIHKGYQLFVLWEQQISTLVGRNFALADEDTGGTTYGRWSQLLGQDTPGLLVRYLEEPIEGRLKSIDDVMRYLRDGWQSMLLIDPTTNALKLVCLLDTPPSAPEHKYISLNTDFDHAFDKDELIQIEVVDEGSLFLPGGTVIPPNTPIPESLRQKFPRHVITQRLTLGEAGLEVELQRARLASHTKVGSAVLPAPETAAELNALLPGQSITLDNRAFWITETTVSWPGDTVALDLYQPGYF